jgi:hypothetical protein
MWRQRTMVKISAVTTFVDPMNIRVIVLTTLDFPLRIQAMVLQAQNKSF